MYRYHRTSDGHHDPGDDPMNDRLNDKLAPLLRRAPAPAPAPTCRVVVDRYRGSTGPLAQAMCRCGWRGTDNADPATAEAEAAAHEVTP